MIKQTTQFKSVINEIENNFYFDSSCPTNVAKESLFACLKWLGQIEDQVKAHEESLKQKQAEEQKEEIDDEPTA